jgi:hypothetical protein
LRKHVIISGTGRAGTSFLVTLLTKLGFDTGFTPATLRLHPLSRAGLELDIRRKDAPYIIKNPWLSQTLSEALIDPDIRIEHAIVPFRAIAGATASRRRVDRMGKREGTSLPGGLWLTEDPLRQREVLERQLAKLFETLAKHEIPVTLLWFPRLVHDPEYLFRRLAWLFGDTTRAEFRRVFREAARPEWVHEFPEPAGKQESIQASVRSAGFRGSPAEEATLGEMSYLEVLARLHLELKPSLYLEIGVRHGKSLVLARGQAIGVDPQPDLQFELPPKTDILVQTSDEFFNSGVGQALCGAPELVFIDGMHHFECAVRDFMHAERLMPRHGLIVIDDIFPNHPAQAERTRRTGTWTGDVWKLKHILETYRPDLSLLPLDTAPSGLLLVAGLDPANTVLRTNYAAILEHYRETVAPANVLSRQGCVSPKGPELGAWLQTLVQAKLQQLTPTEITQRLKQIPLSTAR